MMISKGSTAAFFLAAALIAPNLATAQNAQPANASEHPVRDALRMCTDVLTGVRSATSPKTIGFKPQQRGKPRLDLPGGHWVELSLDRDDKLGSLGCSLRFDGNQDDLETNTAVTLAVGRLGLKRIAVEYEPRGRRVPDAVVRTYEGMSSRRRLVIVHRSLSAVPRDEPRGQDVVQVISYNLRAEPTPIPDRRRPAD